MSMAIESLRAERGVLLDLCAGLDDATWKSPSGCPGWSVQDVVAHMGALYWLVVDRTVLPDVSGVPTERAQDVLVESRRSLPAATVLEDYASVSASAIAALAELEPLDFEVPLGDLGTYPVGVLPTSFAFDHYTHIRADLFAPRGPIDGPAPPSDELRLAPALDWVEAAAPQQNGALVAELDGGVAIELDGPSARSFTIGTGPVVARLACGTADFVLLATRRLGWDEAAVRTEGDERALAAVRRLHLF